MFSFQCEQYFRSIVAYPLILLGFSQVMKKQQSQVSESVWLADKGRNPLAGHLYFWTQSVRYLSFRRPCKSSGYFPCSICLVIALQSNDQSSLKTEESFLKTTGSSGAELAFTVPDACFAYDVRKHEAQNIFAAKGIILLCSNWILKFSSHQSVCILWSKAAKADAKAVTAVTWNFGYYSAQELHKQKLSITCAPYPAPKTGTVINPCFTPLSWLWP